MRAISVAACCLTALSALVAAHAADTPNMYFSGQLVAEPCMLAPQDGLRELDFNAVVDKDLYLHGRSSGRPITLRLLNCDITEGRTQISVTFGGSPSAALPGLVQLDGGGASGLAIGLETLQGGALPLDTKNPLGVITTGTNDIAFMAYLQAEPDAQADRTIGLGPIKASVTFTLNYD